MKAHLIAEIGCNHKGDIEIAKEMILTAKTVCKVNIVKFQKRNNKDLLCEKVYNSPHPNPIHSYGRTYGEHREYLEFSIEKHKILKDFCDSLGVIYSSSVWDLTSAQEITSISPEFIKIPSACNNNFKMLNWLCDNYKGKIHLSTGMTTKNELEHIIELFVNKKRNKDLVLYSCTSGYPVEFNDLCLLEIKKYKEIYGSIVEAIGFSGHHHGIAVDIAAFVLGATYIERHFTLDRIWKGTDHAASLEPGGLLRLRRDLIATEKALSYKKKDILDVEKIQRQKLKYNAII